jgi:hypothetical protein
MDFFNGSSRGSVLLFAGQKEREIWLCFLIPDWTMWWIVHSEEIRVVSKGIGYNWNKEHSDFKSWCFYSWRRRTYGKHPRDVTAIFVNHSSVTGRQFLEARAFIHRESYWTIKSDLFPDSVLKGYQTCHKMFSTFKTAIVSGFHEFLSLVKFWAIGGDSL